MGMGFIDLFQSLRGRSQGGGRRLPPGLLNAIASTGPFTQPNQANINRQNNPPQGQFRRGLRLGSFERVRPTGGAVSLRSQRNNLFHAQGLLTRPRNNTLLGF